MHGSARKEAPSLRFSHHPAGHLAWFIRPFSTGEAAKEPEAEPVEADVTRPGGARRARQR